MNKLSSVILLASGTGSRMKNSTPKQYMTINGKTLIDICVEKFNSISSISEIILIINETEINKFKEHFHENKKIKIFSGGKTRQLSCNVGLRNIDEKSHFVLIHDVARVLVSEEIINNCIKYLQEGFDCCAPYINSYNSLLKSDENNNYQYCDRSKIKNIQTPQAFKKDLIVKSINYSDNYTDNMGQIVAYNKNIKVKLFEGESKNFKITVMHDFSVAENLLINKQEISKLTFDGKNKKALVFGGTSGIGEEIVKNLKKNGVETHLSSQSIRIENDDLSLYKNVDWDIIVNCIGTMRGKTGKNIITPFKDMSLEDFNYVIDVNYISCVKIAKLARETMRKGGHLLMIGSSSTKKGRKDFSSYSSTKTAVLSLVESLAEEFIDDNIMVNCLHPSRTYTKMRTVFNNEDVDKMLLPSEVGRVAMGFCNGNVTGQNFYLKVGDKIE